MIKLMKFSIELTGDHMRYISGLRRKFLYDILKEYHAYNARAITPHPIPLVSLMRSIKINQAYDSISIGIREDSKIYKELEDLEYGEKDIRVVRVALENIFIRYGGGA